MIDGLKIEEQLNFFRIGNGLYRKEPVSERRKNKWNYSNRVEAEDGVESLIICDGKIVGIMVKECNGHLKACLPEYGYLIRDDEEEDGSGYKEFKLYKYLICVSEHFDDAE